VLSAQLNKSAFVRSRQTCRVSQTKMSETSRS